jgi:hypothetical protein
MSPMVQDWKWHAKVMLYVAICVEMSEIKGTLQNN